MSSTITGVLSEEHLSVFGISKGETLYHATLLSKGLRIPVVIPERYAKLLGERVSLNGFLTSTYEDKLFTYFHCNIVEKTEEKDSLEVEVRGHYRKSNVSVEDDTSERVFKVVKYNPGKTHRVIHITATKKFDEQLDALKHNDSICCVGKITTRRGLSVTLTEIRGGNA